MHEQYSRKQRTASRVKNFMRGAVVMAICMSGLFLVCAHATADPRIDQVMLLSGDFEAAYESLLWTSTGYYFLLESPESAWGLWVSDGTAEGTYMIKDLTEADAPSAAKIEKGVPLSEPVYFKAYAGNSSLEGGQVLWKTDGTYAGTIKIQEIEENLDTVYTSVQAKDGVVLFIKEEFDVVSSMWRSEGTPESTRMLRLQEYSTTEFKGYGIWGWSDNKFYCNGWDEEHGRELYVTDATGQEYTLIKDIHPGPQSSIIRVF